MCMEKKYYKNTENLNVIPDGYEYEDFSSNKKSEKIDDD